MGGGLPGVRLPHAEAGDGQALFDATEFPAETILTGTDGSGGSWILGG